MCRDITPRTASGESASICKLSSLTVLAHNSYFSFTVQHDHIASFSFIHNISAHFTHNIRSGFYIVPDKLILKNTTDFSQVYTIYKRLEGFKHKLAHYRERKGWVRGSVCNGAPLRPLTQFEEMLEGKDWYNCCCDWGFMFKLLSENLFLSFPSL